MIKVLTGALSRDSGQIEFGGAPIAFGSPQEAQRGGVSTIFQEINLVPFRTVTENIFLGRELKRFGLLDWGRMNREAAETLRRFNIEIDVRRPLMEFSTAIQQMVAIARAVSFEARLVIMDEPTSSLDEREVAVLFDVMRQLKAQGVAIIFVSHRLDELYAICDRVTVMRDGRTVMTREMGEIDKLSLVSAMLGRDIETVRGHATGFTAARAQGRRAGPGGRGPADRPPRARRAAASARGQIVGLAGLLGSGRTETARAVFGADPADAGVIRLRGETVSPQQPADAIAPRRRLLQRGPQGRRHRARHVGAREPHARHPAPPRVGRRGRRGPSSARSSTSSSSASASRPPAPNRRSANCRAATSRRCCSRAGSAPIPSC